MDGCMHVMHVCFPSICDLRAYVYMHTGVRMYAYGCTDVCIRAYRCMHTTYGFHLIDYRAPWMHACMAMMRLLQGLFFSGFAACTAAMPPYDRSIVKSNFFF